MRLPPHFQINHQKRQCNAFDYNPAFQSLSFRGNKGYPKRKCPRPVIEYNNQKASNSFKVATYGAIIRINSVPEKERYALVRGSYTGKWSFPKGHSNEGELPIECTLREVAEETGIDELPEPLEYIKVGYGNYFIFSLDEQIPLNPRDTLEIIDTKWATLDEMERMPLNADASLYRKQLIAQHAD